MSDLEFDPERTRELARKAERNEIRGEEIVELREQKDALFDTFQSVVEAVIPEMLRCREAVEGATSALRELHKAMEEDEPTQEEKRRQEYETEAFIRISGTELWEPTVERFEEEDCDGE